jgi:hypothetical protein
MPGRARPPSLPAARRERVDLTEGPVHGRVGRHVAEQTLLGPQRLDVRARLAAPGEHQHRLHQDLAPVMDRQPLSGRRAPGDSTSPRLSRSANDRRACSPTWATTPSPPASILTRRVLLRFTCQVPFPLDISMCRTNENALLEVPCRVLPTSRHLMAS